jgi:hypothetical protein
MASMPYVMSSAELFARAQMVLGVTQEGLGRLLGYSRRTIIRYQQRGGLLLPSHVETLARACYAKDRAFAAMIAARHGTTLVQLGIEVPAPPPPPATAVTAPTSSPSPRLLGDSIVCAAAEAMQATPQAIRPALVAAFERAVALGLDAPRALAAIEPPAPPLESSTAKPSKRAKDST